MKHTCDELAADTQATRQFRAANTLFVHQAANLLVDLGQQSFRQEERVSLVTFELF